MQGDTFWLGTMRGLVELHTGVPHGQTAELFPFDGYKMSAKKIDRMIMEKGISNAGIHIASQ